VTCCFDPVDNIPISPGNSLTFCALKDTASAGGSHTITTDCVCHGTSGVSGTSGISGSGGPSGTSGTSGSSGVNGTVPSVAWTPYTPTWNASIANPALADGDIRGWFTTVGTSCFFRGQLTFGNNTNGGTGAWYFGLPVSAIDADGVQAPASLLDNGNAWYLGTMNGARLGSLIESEIQWQDNTGKAIGIDKTTPFTWGAGDRVLWNGTYEIA
jgi:hypothetical protein